MTNQSYIRVLTTLELFAKEHLQVKRFASDFPEQLPNFSSESEQYPILFVSPNNSIFKKNQNTFDLTIYCYDLIQDGRGNINTILSDTNTILNDLYLWLRDGEVGGLEIISDINCTPINNSLLDYVAGWQMTLSIEVDTYNVCEIPFNDEPVILDVVNNIIYSKYLTCETLSECSTIIDIENNLSSITNTVNGFEQSIIDNTESIGQLEEDINNINDSLYLKEDVINKTDVIGTGNTTNYPSTKGIVDYISDVEDNLVDYINSGLATKQDVLTAENVGEFMDLELDTKSTPISGDTLLGRDSITNEAVEIPFSTIQPSLGFTPENVANKTNVIGTGNTTNYPSTKAVVDYVTTTNGTWKKSGLSTNANLVNEVIYRQNSVNLIGTTVNFGTGPSQSDIDNEVLGSQFGHIFGGGTVPFIQLLGNGANGSAGPNQFISRMVGAPTTMQQMTFSVIKSTNYDSWGDAGRLLWRFQDGYLAPQAKFDIGTDYVRLHSYTSSRNDSGDIMNNVLFTTSNGSLRSKPVTDTPFLNKIVQLTNQTLVSSGWTLNAGIYEYDFSYSGITSSSIVDAVPTIASTDTIIAAQIYSQIDSSNGSAKFYSKNLPTSDIIITINIIKN